MRASAYIAVQVEAGWEMANPGGQDKTAGAQHTLTHCLHIFFSEPNAPARAAREFSRSAMNITVDVGAQRNCL